MGIVKEKVQIVEKNILLVNPFAPTAAKSGRKNSTRSKNYFFLKKDNSNSTLVPK